MRFDENFSSECLFYPNTQNLTGYFSIHGNIGGVFIFFCAAVPSVAPSGCSAKRDALNMLCLWILKIGGSNRRFCKRLGGRNVVRRRASAGSMF